MTKRNLITSLQGIVIFTKEIPELSGRVAHVERTIEHLQSPDIDLIVWNDIDVPMTENGMYLITNGIITETLVIEETDSKNNTELLWVNAQMDSPFIKWAKIPEYKSK